LRNVTKNKAVMMEQRPVQTIDSALLDELLRRARLSSRRRAIFCLHDGAWEHAHRMLNALAVGTYVRPHRHEDKHKGEGFIILRGKLALLIFTGAGEIDFGRSRVLSVDGGCLGMDIPPGVWHSLVALEDAVIYEVKGSPRAVTSRRRIKISPRGRRRKVHARPMNIADFCMRRP